ncbi:IclR family transcriptional regulator [Nocardia sp. NRRL S-836]|uniref:IclR family transcriptional regulator n=1 Tax=Nocardia sp. NRRL S-836 TaxID=1519492 RepID=UPI0006B055CF|nr:IclR family transcriptional regulator [Nocardia sp. NRRL S-836]KOV82872.1 IclR family transcriptional regulator [Nocardia sp. NRRL S-836]
MYATGTAGQGGTGQNSGVTATVSAKLLSLLGTFDTRHRSQTLSAIARRSGLPVSTTHRLLAELEAWGAVRRLAGGEYVIGRRIWRLGLLAAGEVDLSRVAEPFLHDIHAATRAVVHLAVREGVEVLYLDRVSGHASVPIVSTTGSRLPLHTTGVGKVLLAHAPAEVQEEVLAHRLTRCTAYTIVEPGRLRAQLHRVRRDGYAQTFEEMTLGACSVAVPVEVDGRVVAALGIVVPDLRNVRGRLVAALQVAARGIGRAMGSGFHPPETRLG